MGRNYGRCENDIDKNPSMGSKPMDRFENVSEEPFSPIKFYQERRGITEFYRRACNKTRP